MPVIRIDDEVATKLQELAKTFPSFTSRNAVLRSMLGIEDKTAALKTMRRIGRVVAIVSRTPSSRFEQPILDVLEREGGKLRCHVVLKRVRAQMSRRFKPEDLKTLKNGELRWQNSAKLARKNLIKYGLLKTHSSHGYWEISDAGRGVLKEPPF